MIHKTKTKTTYPAKSHKIQSLGMIHKSTYVQYRIIIIHRKMSTTTFYHLEWIITARCQRTSENASLPTRTKPETLLTIDSTIQPAKKLKIAEDLLEPLYLHKVRVRLCTPQPPQTPLLVDDDSGQRKEIESMKVCLTTTGIRNVNSKNG